MMSQESFFWKIFEATGSPNMYLLFKRSKKTSKEGDPNNFGL